MVSVRNRMLRGLALALVIALFSGCGNSEDPLNEPDQVHEVSRGDFNIVITVNGVLDAVKRYLIESPSISKQGLEIIYVVPDQTVLEKGDLVVEFSNENYLEQLESQRIKILEAEKNLMITEQDFQMKLADIVSAIKNSTDAQLVAIEALEKYVSEDAPLLKKNMQQAVVTARQKVVDEEDRLSGLKASLLSASMGDEEAREQLETQVETARLNIENLKNAEEKAAYDLRIFKQYTFPQQSRKLEQNLVKAEMNLQKQLVNSTAQRLQLEGKIQTQERLLRSLQQQEQELVENIAMLKVTAPVSGTLSYGNPDPRRRRGGQQQKEIAVGTTMSRREVVGSIPDMSQLIVNVDIPEISRSKVDPGMRAEMRIKALPNLQLSGEVERVSDMASNLQYWDRSSPKIYPTVVRLHQNDSMLRPGMTIEVDMISEVISDVLFVPVEALFVKEGEVFCHVKKAVGTEVRQVTIGKSSSSYVEIVDGLAEGERVLLSREES